MRIAYPTLLFVGLGCIVLGNVLHGRSGDEFPTYTLVYPGLAIVLASLVAKGILIYQSWRCVLLHAPKFDARRRVLDPAAAVAMTFVPLVNFVGVFFSLGRLPRDLNWLAQRAGLARRAPDNLGYAAAALFAGTLVPLIGLGFGLVAALLLMPPLILSCSALAESIENQLAQAAAAQPSLAGPASEKTPGD